MRDRPQHRVSDRPEPPGRVTGSALAALPPTFKIVHGLKQAPPGRPIDQVVIGPTGIWVVRTPESSGAFEVRDGVLHDEQGSVHDLLDVVEGQAIAARERLGFDANPVVCIVGDQPLLRSAQMVGRVRVVTAAAIAEHIRSGPVTLGLHDIEIATERAEGWKIRPYRAASPAVSASVDPVDRLGPSRSASVSAEVRSVLSRSWSRSRPASRIRRRTVEEAARRPVVPAPVATNPTRRRLASLATVVVFVALLVGAGAVLTQPDAFASWFGSDPTTTTPPPRPRYVTVAVECPSPGAGYELDPTVAAASPRVRVSATVGRTSRYLGEFDASLPVPPITAVPSGFTTRFDIQPLDDSGTVTDSYRLSIETPTTPC